MNAGEIGGWIGVILGGVGGLAGGLIGTYFSIKNTNGPRERGFVKKAAVLCWVAILVFLAVLFAVPSPYRWLVWIPYAVLLPLGIKAWNTRQFAIRRDESQNQPSEATR